MPTLRGQAPSRVCPALTASGSLLGGWGVRPQPHPAYSGALGCTGSSLSSRWYEGEIVVIHTARGNELSITQITRY